MRLCVVLFTSRGTFTQLNSWFGYMFLPPVVLKNHQSKHKLAVPATILYYTSNCLSSIFVRFKAPQFVTAMLRLSLLPCHCVQTQSSAKKLFVWLVWKGTPSQREPVVGEGYVVCSKIPVVEEMIYFRMLNLRSYPLLTFLLHI